MTLSQKIKRSSLLSGAGIYLSASLINAAIPFFLLPILTRYLNPSEYGEVAVYQVWVSLLLALCALGTHSAATRKHYDYDGPDSQMGYFIGSCIQIALIMSLILLAILLATSGWLESWVGLSRVWIFLGVPFAFSMFLIQLRLRQWQVREMPVKYGILQISKSAVDMVMSIVLVVVVGLGVTGRLSGSTAAVVIGGLAALILLRRDGLIKWAWRPDMIKEALSFGVPMTPHILGGFLLLMVDRAIVSSMLGLGAAGYYMVAIQFAMAVGVLTESLNKAYTPWLFSKLKANRDDDKRRVVRITYGYYLVLFVLALLALLFGGPVLVFIAGKQYAPAAEILGWLVLARCLRGMYFMQVGYIIYSKKTGLLAKITLFSGALNVVLLVVMIKLFGLQGAAWAACISMLVQCLVASAASSRVISMPWLGRT